MSPGSPSIVSFSFSKATQESAYGQMCSEFTYNCHENLTKCEGKEKAKLLDFF